MTRRPIGPARGVLSHAADPRFSHARLAPSDRLAPWIAHYWMVAWDLGDGPPHLAETLPHPVVHATVEPRRALVGGVATGKFERRLAGQGRVFGIKFRPAAFAPLWGRPMSALTDRIVPLRSIFGAAGARYARAVRAVADPEACAALADDLLAPLLPADGPPTAVARVRDLVERLQVDRALVRVEQVAALAGADLRTLQRLFRTYVGVGPKWVIQRYRLHEAAAQLADPGTEPLAQLAARLGYFDQAHFIRDFKAVVGRSPLERRAGRAR